jgi:adenosine deaminase
MHAGEEGGPEHVLTAVCEFGASRIGHGYALSRSPEMLRALIVDGVHLEACPTSSFCTSGWADAGPASALPTPPPALARRYGGDGGDVGAEAEGARLGCAAGEAEAGEAVDWADHPLCAFVRAGASVSVSTDDPAVFGTSLHEEYALCEAKMGLTESELVACTLAAARSAFAPREQREALVARIRKAASSLLGVRLADSGEVPSSPSSSERIEAEPEMVLVAA